MEELIGNILSGIAYVVMFGYTFFNVSRKLLLSLQVVVSLIFAIAYIVLKAYTGALCCAFGMVNFILFRYKGKNKFFTLPIVPILCVLVYIIFGILLWDGPMSLIPVFINLIVVFSFWLSKPLYIKAFNIPISILWVIYNGVYHLYVGVVFQIILLILDIVYIIMYFKKYKKEEEKIND